MSNDLHHKLSEHDAKDEVRFRDINGRLDTMLKAVRKWGLIGGFVGGLTASGIHLLGSLQGCASLPKPSVSEVATYLADVAECSKKPTPETVHDCKLLLTSQWCQKYPTDWVCQDVDSGHE